MPKRKEFVRCMTLRWNNEVPSTIPKGEECVLLMAWG